MILILIMILIMILILIRILILINGTQRSAGERGPPAEYDFFFRMPETAYALQKLPVLRSKASELSQKS